MHVERFAALAHERRLAIVRLLMREAPEGIAASEIARQLSLPPTNLSFHIAELQAAGLVKSQRDGRYIHYSVRIDVVRELIDYLIHDCCHGHPELCQPRPANACGCAPTLAPVELKP